jgi:hypothetical protein
VQEQLAIQRLLHRKLEQARLRNPAYSVRALAMKVGLGSPALSEILNGKRRVSLKLALRIGERLCLSPPEVREIAELFPAKRPYARPLEGRLPAGPAGRPGTTSFLRSSK